MHTMIQTAITEVLSRHHSLTERQLRIYVKQAFFNYFLLLLNDIRLFKVNFTDEKEQELSLRDPDKMIGLN